MAADTVDSSVIWCSSGGLYTSCCTSSAVYESSITEIGDLYNIFLHMMQLAHCGQLDASLLAHLTCTRYNRWL